MLDRSGAGDVDDPEQKDVGLNEYLRSFKVASYNVKEGDEVHILAFPSHCRSYIFSLTIYFQDNCDMLHSTKQSETCGLAQ